MRFFRSKTLSHSAFPAVHPCIDLRALKLPEPADLMSRNLILRIANPTAQSNWLNAKIICCLI